MRTRLEQYMYWGSARFRMSEYHRILDPVLETLNRVTLKSIVPQITDNLFKSNPVLDYFKKVSR